MHAEAIPFTTDKGIKEVKNENSELPRRLRSL